MVKQINNAIKTVCWWRDYRWQLVMVVLLGSIVNYVDRVNLSFATIHIRHEFGLTTSQMGYLLAAWMWPYAVANLPSGWLIDKIGINKVFIWSIILWSLATVCSGFSPNFLTLYITRLILGVFEAPFFIIGGKIAKSYFTKQERGLAASVINTGPKIANGFAPPLIAALVLYLSWRGMFISLGLVGFIVVLLWLKIYKQDQTLLNHFKTSEVSFKFSTWRLFKHKTSCWFNLGNFGSSYVFWLYFTWLPTYLIDKRGLNLTMAGWLTALPFLAGVLAVPLGGYLSDYLIKQRGWNVIKARLVPAVGGCIVAGIAVIPINYVNSLTWVVVLFSISTFAVSARVGVLWALVADITPNPAVGTFGGIQNFANFVGGALAPTISGIILQQTNNYNLVFGLSGVLVILAAGCYALIRTPILVKDIALN